MIRRLNAFTDRENRIKARNGGQNVIRVHADDTWF